MSTSCFPSFSDIIAAIGNAEQLEDAEIAASFRSNKEGEEASKWERLAQIFDFHFVPSDAKDPFSPMIIMGGKRSLLPEDLSDSELAELRESLNIVDEPEYVARVADILWLRVRDVQLAKQAVVAYLEAGKKIEDLHSWPPSMERYERSIRLAKQIDPKGELTNSTLEYLETRVLEIDGDDPMFFSLKAVELLLEFGFGDFEKLASACIKVSEKSASMGDRRTAREYLNGAIPLLRKLNQTERIEELNSVIVDLLVADAEDQEASESAMAAHSYWQDAISASRRSSSTRARIPELQKRMASAGEGLVDEMQSFSQEIDISDLVEQSTAALEGLDWEDAFCRFVSGTSILSQSELRKEAQEVIEKHPLQASFPATIYDASGRKVGIRPSALSDDPEQVKKAVDGFVELHASMHRGVLVAGYLAPSLNKLRNDHDVSALTIASLVEDSPFIPPSRKSLFLKGVISGFEYDFSTAAHVLIPQVENGLRKLLQQAGIDPYNVGSDGIQEAWGYERILSNDKLEEIIGADLIFELRSLLISRLGQNLRNLLAHGLVDAKTLNGDAAFYLWWIFLRLIIWPAPVMRRYVQRLREQASPDKGSVVGPSSE